MDTVLSPPGFTAHGIVDAIRAALRENGISGVYAFCNSWPLAAHPHYARILDDWVADGHHVANHTHSHIDLPDMTAAAFIADIDAAEHHLRPWLSKAPLRLFRYPTCHWKETPEKLQAVAAHLAAVSLTAVDVTSWPYEWTWNRAWLNALDAGDQGKQAYAKSSFMEISVTRLRIDIAAANDRFGEEVIAITLGHNVPFFADIAMDYFARPKAKGAVFVPLEQALTGRAQVAVGTVATGEFLVLQQKLATHAGQRLAKLPESQAAVHARIVEMAEGQTG